MSEFLPDQMAAPRLELGAVVERIEKGSPYGAVLLSSHKGMQILAGDREERVTEQPPKAGTVLSSFDGTTIREVSLGGFDLTKINRSAIELAASPSTESVLDAGPARKGDFQSSGARKPEDLSLDEKLAMVRDLHRRSRGGDDRIVNVQVTYDERTQCSVFRNRNADLAQKVQRTRIMVVLVVAGKDGTRYDFRIKSTTRGIEDLEFTDDDLAGLQESAIALLTSDRIEPGDYTVIASPSVGGTICHESFGHCVETDMFLKKRARAANYLDRRVGSPLVNIVDDPTVAGAYGSYFFDDEGQLSTPTLVVEDGTFRRGITDLYSASALGLVRTANGRRQDYSRKAYARMSSTFFAKGTTPVKEIFNQVDNGIYLDAATSGVEDPKGWGIQVTCHSAHEMKRGQLTGRVFAQVGITGYVPDLLDSIRAVGDDWHLDSGYCGKGHKELIETSTGGPHLLMTARLG